MKDKLKTYVQRGTNTGNRAGWYSLLGTYVTAAVGPLNLIAVQCITVQFNAAL